jgi:FdrA protein
VSCLLDAAGVGVSQVIGVGGRDLSAEVGGLVTGLALELLAEDPAVEVVVLVSKPPAAAVAEQVLRQLAALGKPAVACLLGLADGDDPVAVRGTLEGGAGAAAALLGRHLVLPAEDAAQGAVPAPAAAGILGLYTGGTLASEAKVILSRAGRSAEILDLGDDQYTAGRPHPMIDPAARADRVAEVGARPEVGTVLVDLVLGHGASPDPATPLAQAVRTARATAAADGRDLLVVGSVCGTTGDPQGLEAQRAILRDAGVRLFASNAAAARFAASTSGTSAPVVDAAVVEEQP